MKILLVFNHKDVIGGGEISFLRYIDGLLNYQKRGSGQVDKIEFAVFVPGEGEVERSIPKGIKVFKQEVPSFKRNLKGFVKAVRYFADVYSEFLPDVVHINGSRTALCGGIAKLLVKEKPKIIFHSRISEFDVLDPLLLLLLDGVIANSQKTLKRRFLLYRGFFKTFKVRYTVIYNGIDPFSIREKVSSVDRATTKRKYGIPEGKVIVSSAGRIEKGKGFEVFAELSKYSFSRDLCFVLAGKLSPDVGIIRGSDKLILPGYIPEYELFAVTDILVFPSFVDSFGNVVLEAGACGIPCIVSKFAGVSEILENMHDSIIVDPRNVSELVLAIESLIRSDELRRKISANFYKKSELFSIDKHTEKVIEFYRNLLS